MSHITAQPPVAPYVPAKEKQVFRQLLADIAACDEKNGTSTPSTTFLLIQAAARRLGVAPVDLLSDEEG